MQALACDQSNPKSGLECRLRSVVCGSTRSDVAGPARGARLPEADAGHRRRSHAAATGGLCRDRKSGHCHPDQRKGWAAPSNTASSCEQQQ